MAQSVICPRNAHESLAHALPPTARRHHEPIDPAFAAVLRPEDRPHEPAVLLSCEEDRARPRELPRDPLASVTTVRAVREPALLPEAHEGVVVRRSSKAGPVLPCSSVCHDAKLTLRGGSHKPPRRRPPRSPSGAGSTGECGDTSLIWNLGTHHPSPRRLGRSVASARQLVLRPRITRLRPPPPGRGERGLGLLPAPFSALLPARLSALLPEHLRHLLGESNPCNTGSTTPAAQTGTRQQVRTMLRPAPSCSP